MGEDRDTAQDRVTIQEAARRLGVKEDAIRKRIQRGTLRHEKTEAGRVFVWVDATQDATQDTAEDAYRDTYQDARDELLEELKDRVRHLERRLDEERQARTEERRRHDTLLAQLTSRIPAIEAPERAEEAAEGSEPTTTGGGSQTATERPWWRFW